MPIAIPCLCFALAKLETEWKLSVTAGSTNTAVTDRTIRLYRPQRARAGGVGRATHPSRNVLIKWHIVFLNPRHQNQMSLITLDRTKKPLWRSHKHGVTLFCSMNALKGSSLFYPSLCKNQNSPAAALQVLSTGLRFTLPSTMKFTSAVEAWTRGTVLTEVSKSCFTSTLSTLRLLPRVRSPFLPQHPTTSGRSPLLPAASLTHVCTIPSEKEEKERRGQGDKVRSFHRGMCKVQWV